MTAISYFCFQYAWKQILSKDSFMEITAYFAAEFCIDAQSAGRNPGRIAGLPDRWIAVCWINLVAFFSVILFSKAMPVYGSMTRATNPESMSLA